MLFSIVAVSVYIPTHSAGGLPFSTPSPAFMVCTFFDDGHSDRREVTPRGGFDLRETALLRNLTRKLEHLAFFLFAFVFFFLTKK